MNHEERLIHIAKEGKPIRDALGVLERAGFDLTSIETDFSILREAIETYSPPDYPDEYRIRKTPIDITEHLMGETEMVPIMLHSPSSNGRAYKLTAGQRAVLRERYGMTPTKEVIVSEVAVWPGAPTCVRHIVLRSTEHVPSNRKHVLNSCVIDNWVEFCRAVATADDNVRVTNDKERLASRIDKLFENAKARKIEYSITKGKVLYKWLAEYDAIPLTEEKPELVREALRTILLDHNEPMLAALIKEPSFFSDEVKKNTAGNERFSDLLSQYI
jgi:hypothetical protein